MHREEYRARQDNLQVTHDPAATGGLLDLADLAGVDQEGAFRKKAVLDDGRQW